MKSLVHPGLRFLKVALKLGLVIGLLYFLAKKGFLSLSATQSAFSRPDLIFPPLVALVSLSLAGVIRWQWLLRAQNIHLPWSRTLQLTFVGNFFNIALPGAVSGDVVKAFYVAKETHGRRGHVFGSILFDRVAGLSALALVSAGALILDFNSLKGTPLLNGIRLVVALAATAVLIFYGYLFLMHEKHDPLLKVFRKIESRFEKAGSLTRIYEGLRHYHDHRWTVVKVLALSVVIHLVICLSCIGFLHALGEMTIPPKPVFVVVPLGLLVTAVPVMPAGVGTGHAAFGWLFHFLGTARGADVFSLYALTQFTVGGLGGLVYLRFRSREPKLVLDQTEELS